MSQTRFRPTCKRLFKSDKRMMCCFNNSELWKESKSGCCMEAHAVCV